jgi:HlyD family secretion protein
MMFSSIFPRLQNLIPLRLRERLSHVRKGSFLLGILFAIGVGWYFVFGGSDTTTTQATSYVQVEKRTISSSIKATGKVTFASEQDLSFNLKGTVTKVNVKEGDTVKKGQIIAELDQTAVLQDIRQAELSAAASALQMQQLQAQKQQTIIDAENAAQDAERALTVAEQKLPSDLAAAERAVGEKESALAQAKLDLEKQTTTELQSLASTAQSALSTGEQLLDSFYSVLTRDATARPQLGNYDIDIDNLLYNDLTQKLQVENAYLDAMNVANDMHEKFGTSLATQRDTAVLMDALDDAHSLAEAVYRLGENTYTMLMGATTGTSGFTPSDLSTLRSTVSSNRTKAATLVNTVETAQANLAAAATGDGIPSVTLKQKQDAVTSAENTLQLAEDNLKVLQTQTPGNLQEQQDTVQSKTAAASATTTTTNVNIQLKQNDYAQKQVAVQKARKSLEDYRLTAPFDGIITSVDYKVGDNLLDDTGSSKSIVLQNQSSIIVTIPLDQVDVVLVSKDMPATISYDAITGQTFDGIIDSIDSTPIESSSVVSYNVEVRMTTPEKYTILSGMTTTVTIETMKMENILAVPNLALKTSGSTKMVQKEDGTSVVVETGVTDGRYTEIISGLSEGDSIASVNIASTTTTGSTSSTGGNRDPSMQLMRTLNGGGGGPPPGA